MLEKIPTIKPISEENGNARFSLLQRLMWIFGDEKDCKHMRFHCKYINSDSQPITHFCQTKLFKEMKDKCTRGELPVCILLYYDDFRKFRGTYGSTGGLYFTLASKL